MKRSLPLFAVLIVFCTTAATAPTVSAGEGVTWGIHALGGGRYDDLRMCVGSPAGVPGGPIMDIYVDLRFSVGEKGTLALNLPVMRPVLFGAAFSMLQFEPQLTYEYRLGEKSPYFVLGGGLGGIFHFGPDYNSDPETPGMSFFAAGPMVSFSAGIAFKTRNYGTWMPGLKAFYAPLFSRDYPVATVAGGGVELHYIFD